LAGSADKWADNADRLPPRVHAVELAVFLILIAPSLVLGALLRPPDSIGFAVTAASTIARDVGLVAVVLYFLWRNGEPLQRIGWRRSNLTTEALIGVVLFGPTVAVTSVLGALLSRAGLSAPSSAPAFLHAQGAAETALAVVLVTVVAVAEETLFRGYLLLRLRALTRNTAAAVVLASVIFGLGHGYEGSAGIVTVTVLGALYAIVYVWRQNLTAPIVMHFLQDFIGIVLLPHFANGP
jgi:membrane protease YdiL (CAAX protease family)